MIKMKQKTNEKQLTNETSKQGNCTAPLWFAKKPIHIDIPVCSI